VLTEHRSGAELQRLPLDAQAPEVRIAFEHSVLGTPVVDRYRFTPRARLVEERSTARATACRTPPARAKAAAQWQRLAVADRPRVDPLVVRPLPQQRMRLLAGGREWLLSAFSTQAIEFTARGCPAIASPT
jgi:hypothetical protein